MNVLLALLGIAGTSWALFAWGSSDAPGDLIIERIVVGAVSLGWLGLLYTQAVKNIPKEWDAKKEKEIGELKAKAIPRLRFVYDGKDTKYLETKRILVSRTPKLYQVGRVAVKNDSESESVLKAEITLVHCNKDGVNSPETIDRKLIAPSLGQPILDIHAQRTENFDLFRIRGEGKARGIEFGPFADGSYKTIPAGKYAVKVTASAASMSRIYQMYFLSLDEDQKVTFRPYQQGDTSHGYPLADLNQSELLERPLPTDTPA